MTHWLALAALASAAAAAFGLTPRDLPSREIPSQHPPFGEVTPHHWREAARALLTLAVLRRSPRLDSSELAEACHVLAAELESGAPAPVALASVAATSPPAVREALLTLDDPLGPDPDPQSRPLRALQATWQLSRASGASMSEVLRQFGGALGQEVRLEAESRAAVAGVRASAVVVAGLPVVGMFLGLILGAGPVGFLTTPPWGVLCLCAGCLLELAGLMWLRTLLASIR